MTKWLIVSALLVFPSCVFHGSCYREMTGRILSKVDSLPQAGIMIIISTADDTCYYSIHYTDHDGYYGMDGLGDPQSDCDEDHTMPDKFSVRVFNSTNTRKLADTVFVVADYQLNGDDIVLPNIYVDEK